ncbi:MAG: sulfurtransferase, partial [Alphaproteobacteria bacterium]
MTKAPTVSTEWLAEHLEQAKVLDGSFYLPAEKRDAEAEFAGAHIPSAQRFNIDVVCAPGGDPPHMF